MEEKKETLTLNGSPVTREQLEEARKNKKSSERLVEIAPNTFKILTVLRGSAEHIVNPIV